MPFGLILTPDADRRIGSHVNAPALREQPGARPNGGTPLNDEQRSVPYGFCHCGCGQRTRIPDRDYPRDGEVKGRPLRFIQGHNTRVAPTKTRGLTDAWIVDENGCWLWQRTIDRGGYGALNGSTAHRFVYEMYRGPIPEGLHIDHLCRVRHCVNPDHMEPVTKAENCRRGVNAKITADIAKEMKRRLRCDESAVAIARAFGVAPSVVYNLKYGRTWRDI
jgi:hypothetical protein